MLSRHGTVQSEIPSKKRQNVVLERPSYFNRHEDRDFIVLGTGATLNEYGEKIKALIQDQNLIIIGVNSISSFIAPDYHGIINRTRLIQYGQTIDKNKSRALLSVYHTDALIDEYCQAEHDLIMWRDTGESQQCDIDSKGIITHHGGSATLMVMVAYVMGAKQIYVAGTDGYIDPSSDYHSIHYTDTPYKDNLNKEELESKARYWFTDVQPQAFDTIKLWSKKNNRRPFLMITPTQYQQHYAPKILHNY